MDWLDLRPLPLWANAAVFLAAAGAVWFAGGKISRYANTIAERTGIGKALIGLLVLGGITSLPEVAVSISAGLGADPALAVNTLLGGVAMQVAILSIADLIYGRDALSSIIAKPVVLLQAALDIVLLVVVAAGITIEDVGIFGVGLWASSILVLYLVSIWLVKVYEWAPGWKPHDDEGRSERAAERSPEAVDTEQSLRRLVLFTVAAGATIFVAGIVLSLAGDAIAVQTGLGHSFVGAAFVALSTSLPEVSTVVAAVRIHQYELAFSDIFGTNLFDIGLIFLVDAIDPAGLALNEVGQFSLVAALLGIAVTTVYLIGLIERKNRAIFRMGIDSIIVLLLYIGGMVLLYQLR